MIYQPYEHKSIRLISGIKTTFLFTTEGKSSHDKQDVFASVWDERVAVSKQSGQQEDTLSRPARLSPSHQRKTHAR